MQVTDDRDEEIKFLGYTEKELCSYERRRKRWVAILYALDVGFMFVGVGFMFRGMVDLQGYMLFLMVLDGCMTLAFTAVSRVGLDFSVWLWKTSHRATGCVFGVVCSGAGVSEVVGCRQPVADAAMLGGLLLREARRGRRKNRALLKKLRAFEDAGDGWKVWIRTWGDYIVDISVEDKERLQNE